MGKQPEQTGTRQRQQTCVNMERVINNTICTVGDNDRLKQTRGQIQAHLTPTRGISLLNLTALLFKRLKQNVSAAGLVPELSRSPQEARQPQPQLQCPNELAAARPSVPADPDPRGAAVHHVRRPGGINALCPALLHRQ